MTNAKDIAKIVMNFGIGMVCISYSIFVFLKILATFSVISYYGWEDTASIIFK